MSNTCFVQKAKFSSSSPEHEKESTLLRSADSVSLAGTARWKILRLLLVTVTMRSQSLNLHLENQLISPKFLLTSFQLSYSLDVQMLEIRHCLIADSKEGGSCLQNTPNDYVTRDIRDGVAKLGDLQFRVLDSAGLEAETSSGSVLGRTAAMTGEVLAKAQFVLFLIDARDGLQPMDLDVGKWLRVHASGIKIIVVMNKAELLDQFSGSLAAASGEAYTLGFGDPIALSTETGLGMTELHATLRPILQDYVLHFLKEEDLQDSGSLGDEEDDFKLPLQLAIVGRPNVGKSTLLNAILLENRILVGPEAGLTRDSIRVQFSTTGEAYIL